MSSRVSRHCLTKLADPLRVSCSRLDKFLIPDVSVKSARSFSTQQQKKNQLSAHVAAPLVVNVEWGDGLSVLLHSDWLRDNCQSIRHPLTTQKISNVAEDTPGVFVVDVQSSHKMKSSNNSHSNNLNNNNNNNNVYDKNKNDLIVKWSDNRTSSFDSHWLRSQFPNASTRNDKSKSNLENNFQFSNSDILQNKSSSSNLSNLLNISNTQNESFKNIKNDPFLNALKATDEVPRCSYDKVMALHNNNNNVNNNDNNDEGVHEWLTSLMNAGICIIDNVPNEINNKTGYVNKIASQISKPMSTIYGETFDVRIEEKPINIAYTNEKLDLHMDLPYYESPPGIQFLHCIEFNSNIIGGESIFYDTFILVELLKQHDYKAYETLCKIPATFIKDHIDRDEPVQLIYRRPHIQLNHLGEVISVFWSPAFEGPLILDGDLENPLHVQEYYRAYRIFMNIINNKELQSKWQINFKLKPGEMVTFNQRRLLHGRNSFEVPSMTTSTSTSSHTDEKMTSRWFEGCYVSMDDFLNRFRTLRLKYNNKNIMKNKNDNENDLIGRGIESALRVGNGCYH